MARCKMKIRSKTEFDDGLANVHMEVTAEGDENKAFFKNFPNGYMDLNSVSPEVAKELETGKEYYIDIVRVK